MGPDFHTTGTKKNLKVRRERLYHFNMKSGNPQTLPEAQRPRGLSSSLHSFLIRITKLYRTISMQNDQDVERPNFY